MSASIDEQQRGQPQKVGLVEVGEVHPALRPLVAGGVLRQSRLGKEQSVVTHPEDLVGDRKKSACDDDQRPASPPARGDQHHDQGQPADEGEFGADEDGQACQEGEPRIEEPADRVALRWVLVGSQCLRPADHRPPQQAEIGQHQTVFEARRGEVACRRNGHVDQHACRQQQRPTAQQARRVQPSGAEHQEDDACDAEHQRQPQRHVFELRWPADQAAEIVQIGPQSGRVRLDALTLVEDGAVARQQVSHGAQYDQAVVGDPAPLPRPAAEQRGGDEHAQPQADSRGDVVGKRGPALSPREQRHRWFRSTRPPEAEVPGPSTRCPPVRLPARRRRRRHSAGSRS